MVRHMYAVRLPFKLRVSASELFAELSICFPDRPTICKEQQMGLVSVILKALSFSIC
jgi:hypothetical protein